MLNQNIINNVGKRSSQRSRTSIKNCCEVTLRAKFQEITKCQLPNIVKKIQNKVTIVFLFVRFLEIAWHWSTQILNLSHFPYASVIYISDIKNLFSADFWPVNMYHPIDIQMHLLFDFPFFQFGLQIKKPLNVNSSDYL